MSPTWVNADGKIIRDYNGTGPWSADKIQSRYATYASELKVSCLRDLTPFTCEEHNSRWIYPVMENVIKGIDAGDPACAIIGIEFIEEDQGFVNGAILKSNTARALRRTSLTSVQVERIRKRVSEMLLAGNVPHEYKEYAKLLRHVGVTPIWQSIENRVSVDRRRDRRFYNYFKMVVESEK